jgi:hypothetical protein
MRDLFYFIYFDNFPMTNFQPLFGGNGHDFDDNKYLIKTIKLLK